MAASVRSSSRILAEEYDKADLNNKSSHVLSVLQILDPSFELAFKFDVQIFATTHSLEMIQAFIDTGLNYKEAGAYFELARSPRNKQIIGIKREIETLDYALKHGKGVRDDYECLEGLNEKRLTDALKELAAEIQKRDIQKVGIVIDNDNFTKEQRLDFVNHCLQNTFLEAANLANTSD